MKEIMSVKECASYLSLSEDTIKKYVKERSIPHSKVNGNVRFRLLLIDKWIADGER